MSTSPHEGIVLFDAAEFDADSPIDTAVVRDALVGSALHKADQAAQSRACYAGTNGSQDGQDFVVPTTAGGSLEVATGSTNGARWYGFGLTSVVVPKVRADGEGYELRARLGGRSSNGGRVDFLISVSPRMTTRLQQSFGGTPVYQNKLFTNITSTTVAWLTPDDASHMIEVPRSLIDEALALEPAWVTKTDIGGANITMPLPLLEVRPFAQTWNAGTLPELHGWSVAGYIGA